MTGRTRSQFVDVREGFGARTRGLTADVDNVGPSRDHRDGRIDRALGVQVTSAVRERIRRDVEDTHDEGASAERERLPAGKRDRVGRAVGSEMGHECTGCDPRINKGVPRLTPVSAA